MTEDQDNAGDVVAGAVRVALTAAGQLAEQAARRREADLRQAERDSAARVGTLQSQLAAERELALQSVRDVVQRGDAATVEDVAHAWEQSRTWEDPGMAAERSKLADQIRERFGIDPPELGAGHGNREQATAAALTVRDVQLQAQDAQHRPPAHDRVAVLQAELLGAGVEEEAAAARALAAQSHPTSASEAARAPQGASVGKPRGRQRARATEMQSPGR